MCGLPSVSTNAPDANVRRCGSHPGIKIGLQLFNRPLNLAPEGDAVELVEHFYR
jgi:hypothetical protein